MNKERNSLLDKQNKYRFLNPEEKRKLKRLNEEILGENKNISFDSNVDLSVQFEKKGYDTQRYDIKKIVNSRLYETQVFNPSKVAERLDEFEGEKNPDDMIVTQIIKNHNEENERKDEILYSEVENIVHKEINVNLSNEDEQDNLILLYKNDDINNFDNRGAKFSYSEENREKLNEIFSDLEDLEDEEDIDDEENNNKRKHKYIIVILICIILITSIYISYHSFVKSSNTLTLKNENAVEVQNMYNYDIEKAKLDFQNLEKPLKSDVKSDYNGVVKISNSNSSCTAIEITNDNFRYTDDSNDTDYFNNFVFANTKNNDSGYDYTIIFGKNDPTFFGSLKYLDDVDYFNSISINYEVNDILNTYSGLAYYETDLLNDNFYKMMDNEELVEFIKSELEKSIYPIGKYSDISDQDKILTLITYDEENNLYHVLHTISKV